ncbi:hypothetical protein V6N11_080355 [Hibiscus sabdariffa]|uniref:Uncharacterized protein n=1 Tax=Hibiscus sabdariffa TaxID=183260 RepID=A0ABR2R7H0_9ROSI
MSSRTASIFLDCVGASEATRTTGDVAEVVAITRKGLGSGGGLRLLDQRGLWLIIGWHFLGEHDPWPPHVSRMPTFYLLPVVVSGEWLFGIRTTGPLPPLDPFAFLRMGRPSQS